jgi:hypothetical protein
MLSVNFAVKAGESPLQETNLESDLAHFIENVRSVASILCRVICKISNRIEDAHPMAILILPSMTGIDNQLSLCVCIFI